MPAIDIVDETFVAAPRARVAAVVADRARWRGWWPGLDLVVYMDRGLDGIRWTVTGELVGSAEIWLEAWQQGVILHAYLRADPTIPGSPTQPRAVPATPRGLRHLRVLRERHAIAFKRQAWAIKDELEAVGQARGVS